MSTLFMQRDGTVILNGHVLNILRELPDESVNCCVTSPPYWGLRDYGHDGQLGLEKTPEEYTAKLVEVFREVRRVMRGDGTLWLNLGDSFFGSWGNYSGENRGKEGGQRDIVNGSSAPNPAYDGLESYRPPTAGKHPVLKPKDLVGIPWRVAFALQADGWWLRQDIIWCLSGGTVVYARTQKGDMPMTVKDAARLDPATIRLWNGEKWTQVLGWSRTARNADELEIVLRSGERIGCTPTHQFPTGRGLLRASDIVVGDTLQRAELPQPEQPNRPDHIGDDAAWFAGLYLAEGSMSDDTIQIAGNASQVERFERVSEIAASYGGSATCTVDGNTQSIRVYGKLLVAIVRELVSGKTAKNKCLSSVCWRYGNDFLRAYLDGYLSGDGHHDEGNGRWRLGFTRNYNLERDLRTLAARLGIHLVLNPVFVDGFGKKWPAFKGEIRFSRSGHHNEKNTAEVVEIRRSRCREVYDVGVEDEPHLFALASGILTHNSKPNPMPESVTDRCTKSHEYIFLLSKSERYYYDSDAIAEPCTHANEAKYDNGLNGHGGGESHKGQGSSTRKFRKAGNKSHKYVDEYENSDTEEHRTKAGLMQVADKTWEVRNRRSVWTVTTKPFKGAHFATFPPDLIKPCILAGCPEGGTVLDPFLGSGTTAVVSRDLGRKCIGIELNVEYCQLAANRFRQRTLFTTESE